MKTKPISRVAMLAASIFMLNAGAVAAAVPAGTPAALPVTVQGTLPGYTDTALAQVVRSCVAGMPVSSSMNAAPNGAWHLQVRVDDIHTPRTATLLGATLLDGTHVVDSSWMRTAALDTAPQAVLCRSVSGLTQRVLTPSRP